MLKFLPSLADADPAKFGEEDLEIWYSFVCLVRGANGPYCSRGKSEKNQKIAEEGRRLFGLGPPRDFDGRDTSFGRSSEDYCNFIDSLIDRTS